MSAPEDRAGNQKDVRRETVMLLHGLWFGPSSTWLLARRLRHAGFDTVPFGYGTLRRDLAQHARRLAERLLAFPPGVRVHLVGHSLGGLVILRMLDEYRGLPPGRVVCLGSPVRGSAAARRLASNRLTGAFLGRSRETLQKGFEHLPADREVGLIAGTLGVGAGRVIRDLDSPNDGTVAVSETRLDAAVHHTLPVSHTGLILSRAVARAVAEFLRHGRFDP